MLINANPSDSKTQQAYEWRGAESLVLADELLRSGIPMTITAKRFGISRENLMATYKRAGREWPGRRGPAHNAKQVSA